jgi:hypothetical protein
MVIPLCGRVRLALLRALLIIAGTADISWPEIIA